MVFFTFSVYLSLVLQMRLRYRILTTTFAGEESFAELKVASVRVYSRLYASTLSATCGIPRFSIMSLHFKRSFRQVSSFFF
jgi:hypothetical protein